MEKARQAMQHAMNNKLISEKQTEKQPMQGNQDGRQALQKQLMLDQQILAKRCEAKMKKMTMKSAAKGDGDVDVDRTEKAKLPPTEQLLREMEMKVLKTTDKNISVIPFPSSSSSSSSGASGTSPPGPAAAISSQSQSPVAPATQPPLQPPPAGLLPWVPGVPGVPGGLNPAAPPFAPAPRVGTSGNTNINGTTSTSAGNNTTNVPAPPALPPGLPPPQPPPLPAQQPPPLPPSLMNTVFPAPGGGGALAHSGIAPPPGFPAPPVLLLNLFKLFKYFLFNFK